MISEVIFRHTTELKHAPHWLHATFREIIFTVLKTESLTYLIFTILSYVRNSLDINYVHFIKKI